VAKALAAELRGDGSKSDTIWLSAQGLVEPDGDVHRTLRVDELIKVSDPLER
jgi:hypothetical protein